VHQAENKVDQRFGRVLAFNSTMSKTWINSVDWAGPIETIVEAVIALWLFDIFFRPRKRNLGARG
jgi:hypothetical protein